MSQNQAVQVALASGGGTRFLSLDALGGLLANVGAQKTTLNVSAAAVIKAGPGRFFGLLISAPGTTSGAWTVNDVLTTGAAAASNQIGTMAYNATANVAGALLFGSLGGIPFSTGLVLSAVPGAGSPLCTVLWA